MNLLVKRCQRQIKCEGIKLVWGLKDTHIICTYSRGYWIKLPKRSQKDAVYFRAENNHETKEKEKKPRLVQTWVENDFSFNFHAYQRWLIRWGKIFGQAVIPGNFKRRSQWPIRFWYIVLVTHRSHVYTLQSTGDVLTRSTLPSSLSVLVHLPKPKLWVTRNRI